MHSPFPGMNPYLEQYWADIHQRLSINSSDALQKQLPGDLRARVNERRVRRVRGWEAARHRP